MKNVVDLHEYRKAQKIVEDIPNIIKILDECQGKLYTYMQYRDVSDVSHSINEARYMMELNYRVYKNILEKKGAIYE